MQPLHHQSVLEIDEKEEESPQSSESKKQGTLANAQQTIEEILIDGSKSGEITNLKAE